MMGVNPAQLAEMQKTSQFIKAKVVVDYEEGSVKIGFHSENPEAVALIPSLLDQFTSALASQLSAYFAIDGELIEKNKPESDE